jgi:hypothetical protein
MKNSLLIIHRLLTGLVVLRVQKIVEENQIHYILWTLILLSLKLIADKNGKIYNGNSSTILDEIQNNLNEGWWNLEE